MQILPKLVSFQKDDKALKLNKLDSELREKVIRLLDREGYDLKVASKLQSKKFIIFIDPLSKGLLLWNLIFILAFYIIQLQISLSLAFGPHFTESELQDSYKPTYFTLLGVLILDVILSFFKGYHAFGRGKVIDDGRLVAYHYFFTQFFFDLAVIFFYMIPLIHESFALNFLQLIPLTLIWVKKSKCQEEVEYILQYKKGVRSALVVLLLLGDALLFGNYGACVFIGIDVLLANAQYYGATNQNNPSEYYWLSTNTDYGGYLMNGPWLAQYIYAQFFSTGTLSTLAPGPFARNPIEACYAIFLMIFFMIYASYLADVLVQVVYTYNQGRIIHEENILTFDNFMRIKDVKESTRLRVFNYFQLKWELQFKTESNQQQLMIDRLPLHLKEQLLEEIGFASELRFLQILPKSEALRKLISLQIKRSTVDANSCIFESHKLSNHRRRCLFYIKEGTAKYYISRGKWDSEQQSKPETILNLTNADRALGVYEFITGQDFSICCRSIDLCLIQSLEWTAFMNITSQLKIQEQFFQMQHRVLVQRELHLINKTCLVCQKNHLEIECPRIYISTQIEAEIQHTPRNKLNNRRKVKRRQLKTQKRLPEAMKQMSSSDLFGLFKNMNLAKILTEMVSLEKVREVPIDEAGYFRKYFPEYNIVPTSNTIQQSPF